MNVSAGYKNPELGCAHDAFWQVISDWLCSKAINLFLKCYGFTFRGENSY